MRTAGYTVTETNPFEDQLTITLEMRERSPYINRIHTNWESMREEIIKIFPEPLGIPSEKAGIVTDEDHGDWYRALFGPSVQAGLLMASDLAGYRNDQVYIRNSMQVQLRREAVLDCMPALFRHIQEEEHPAVRVVLAHWVFVYIHPYMDGNGRTEKGTDLFSNK